MKKPASRDLLSRLRQKGINPFSGAFLMVHAYIIGVSLLVNTLMYVAVTQPAIQSELTGSILDVPEVTEQIQADISKRSEALTQDINRIQDVTKVLQDDIARLATDLAEREAPAQQVIVQERIIERVPESATAPAPKRRKPSGPSERSTLGAVIIDDASCETGYAWMSPRLDRWCAREDDFVSEDAS